MEEGISGADLLFGNDFDAPIGEHLPPGFNAAINILKWWVDPGLEGDAYADAPHLYGPALSSFNAVYCGAGTHDPAAGLVFSEGGDGDGMAARGKAGAPRGAKERMKWALKGENKERWTWEYGRTYGLDFFNPYIDFEGFKVQLPGFKVGILRYWDGQSLRYVWQSLLGVSLRHLLQGADAHALQIRSAEQEDERRLPRRRLLAVPQRRPQRRRVAQGPGRGGEEEGSGEEAVRCA